MSSTSAGWRGWRTRSGELEALDVPGASRVRGRGSRDRSPWRRLELPAARRLRPPARGARSDLPVPLRVPQPRLRRLSGLLRALPAGVPGHPGADDREDGLGHRRARPAPRRRAQAPCPARARARSGQAVEGADDRGRAARRSRGKRAGRAVAGRLRGDEGPLVQLLLRERRLSHHHRSWIDDTTLPIATIGMYIERLEAGEDISRPVEAVARRARPNHRRVPLTARRGDLRRRSTRASRSLAWSSRTSRTTTSTSTTGTSRSSGTRCASSARCSPGTASWPTSEDVFYLRHDEVRSALEELRLWWSSGGAGVARGPEHWPQIVARRKTIYEAMRQWPPPPALGRVPDVDHRADLGHALGHHERAHPGVALVQDGAGGGTLTGLAASPGVAEGPARVILHVG